MRWLTSIKTPLWILVAGALVIPGTAVRSARAEEATETPAVAPPPPKYSVWALPNCSRSIRRLQVHETAEAAIDAVNTLRGEGWDVAVLEGEGSWGTAFSVRQTIRGEEPWQPVEASVYTRRCRAGWRCLAKAERLPAKAANVLSEQVQDVGGTVAIVYHVKEVPAEK